MPSWSWRIEVYTSTDSRENLIDILNKTKKDTHPKPSNNGGLPNENSTQGLVQQGGLN